MQAMHDPDGTGFNGEEFDPDQDLDALVWLPGVDYITGWRQAKDAAGELAAGLAEAGVDTAGVRFRADTTSDGTGMVRLVCSVDTAEEVAILLRIAAARLRKAG
jgi:hypothetical protein